MPWTHYSQDKFSDWQLRGASIAALPDLYLALFTAAPNETGTGSGTEVSGNNYSRAHVGFSNFPAATNGTTGSTSNNGSTITFPVPSGTGWGTVVGFAFFDAASGGNMTSYGILTTSQLVNNGATVAFNTNSLQLYVD